MEETSEDKWSKARSVRRTLARGDAQPPGGPRRRGLEGRPWLGLPPKLRPNQGNGCTIYRVCVRGAVCALVVLPSEKEVGGIVQPQS
jgi:hypothetical protein